ncbi:hypothetical protein [Massilia sp. TSP1-1-2]|uniref:hypothetical protein n=1 Tax=Massilia sp. TSP1-1-2 TaxID=2804649 RepID=UPI003CF0E958
MLTYVIATGILFALLAGAHVARMVFENPSLATDPVYLAITACAVMLAAWALLLVRGERKA